MVQTSRLGQFVLSKDSVDVNVISLCSPVRTAERHYITEKSQLWSIVLVCHVSHETEKKEVVVGGGGGKHSGEGLIIQLLRSTHLSDCEHTSHSQVY